MSRSSLLLAASLALAGCGSFTHFQTAKALEAGQMSFDFQSALIAQNEGFHIASRFRAGLGKGFDAGLETDVVSMFFETFQEASRYGLILGDLKWQALHESDSMPVSAALGFGGGTGYLTDFYFGQATFSRDFGGVEPYVAWRYQRFNVDRDFGDPDDIEDIEDSYLDAILDEAEDKRFGLHHLFLGVKVMIGEGIFLAPEVSWYFGDADGVGSIGLAIGWQTP